MAMGDREDRRTPVHVRWVGPTERSAASTLPMGKGREREVGRTDVG